MLLDTLQQDSCQVQTFESHSLGAGSQPSSSQPSSSQSSRSQPYSSHPSRSQASTVVVSNASSDEAVGDAFRRVCSQAASEAGSQLHQEVGSHASPRSCPDGPNVEPILGEWHSTHFDNDMTGPSPLSVQVMQQQLQTSGIQVKPIQPHEMSGFTKMNAENPERVVLEANPPPSFDVQAHSDPWLNRKLIFSTTRLYYLT